MSNTANTENTENTEITLDNIRKQLEAANTLSESLYTIFKLETNEQDKLYSIDPIIWIYNQDTLRKKWEQYLNKCTFHNPDSYRHFNETMDAYLKERMLNNAFARYFQFMYDFYPPGFGNAIVNGIKTNQPVDGAKLFYELKYKNK
jgi:hypothetical protein